MDISHFLNTAQQDMARTQEIMRLIEMAGWKDDPRILRQIAMSQRTGEWEPIVKLLRQRFGSAERLHLFEIPSPADVAGDIPLCYLIWADWKIGPAVGIGLDSIYTHLEIVGPTGAGKSVLSRLAIIQLHNLGMPVWVFDTEDQLKNVIAYCEPCSFLVLDVSKGEFKRNVWQPLPNETFLDVDARMRDVLKQKWVGEAGTGIESEVAHELNAERGLFTMKQFHERLKKRLAKTRNWTEQNYLARLLNRISDLNLQLGLSYEVLEGYPLEEMMTRSIVFRMGNMSADIVFFFVVELLSAVSDIRRQENPNYPGLAIMLDEAQRFFKPAQQSETAVYSLMLDHVQTFRKRRLALLLATQDLFDVPRAVSTNVATGIFFRPLDGDANYKISRSLMLTPEQSKQLQELPKRHAVMRHVGSAKAFIVRVPELNIEHPVGEEQIAAMMAPVLASLKWTPSPLKSETPGQPIEKTNVERSEAHDEARDEGRNGVNSAPVTRDVDSAMSSDLLDHLEDMGAHPWEGATDGDKRRGNSLGVGNARRAKFAALGLIKEHQVRLVRRGNATKLIEVTDKGWAVLEQYKRRTKKPAGRGSFIHQFWQHKIAEHVRASLPDAKVTIEDQTTGKAVDVLVRADNKVIGLEISETTRAEDELRNVVADLGFCDLVFVLAEGERHLQSIKELVSQELSGQDWNRVRFSTLVEFCNSPPSFEAKLL